MSNFFLMTMGDCTQKLFEIVSADFFWETFTLSHNFEQIDLAHFNYNGVDLSSVLFFVLVDDQLCSLDDINQIDNVGVLPDLGHVLSFSLKNVLFLEDLDDHIFSSFVFTKKDRGLRTTV